MSCHIFSLRLASQDRDDRGVDRNGSDYLISINSTSSSDPLSSTWKKEIGSNHQMRIEFLIGWHVALLRSRKVVLLRES